MDLSNVKLQVAMIALLGVLGAAFLSGIAGGALVAWLNRIFNRSHADEQVERDLRIHKVTLVHQQRAEAYAELDAWISAVTDSADDLCFSSELKGLPAAQQNEYDICVAMRQGPLRPPVRGRYLWGREVTQRVRELQNQAIEMAQMVILKHLGPEDEHGHDELELIAGMLRQAMSDHLEGRDERPERLPQPRSRKALKSTSTSVTTNAG